MSYFDFFTFMKIEKKKMKDLSVRNEKEKVLLENKIFGCSKENVKIIDMLKSVTIKSDSMDSIDFYDQILNKLNVLKTPIEQEFLGMKMKRDLAEMMDSEHKKNCDISEQEVQEASVAKVNASTNWMEVRDDYECVLYARSVLIDDFRLKNITDQELSQIKKHGFVNKLFGTKKNENKNNVDYVLSLLSKVDGLKDLNIYKGIDKYRESVEDKFQELLEIKITSEKMNGSLENAEKKRNYAFDKLIKNRRYISDLNDVYIIHRFFEIAEKSDEFDMLGLLTAYGFTDETVESYAENNLKIEMYNRLLASLKKDEDLLYSMRTELSKKIKEMDDAMIDSSYFKFVDFDEKKMAKELSKWSEYLQIRKELRNNAIENITTMNNQIFENSLEAFSYLLFLDKEDCLNYKSTFFNKEEMKWFSNDMMGLNSCNVFVEYPSQMQEIVESKDCSMEITTVNLEIISEPRDSDYDSEIERTPFSYSGNILTNDSNNMTYDFNDTGVSDTGVSNFD